jgi:E3 ubiquitin-protein ligase UBR4
MLNGFAQFVLGLPEKHTEIRDLIFNEPVVSDAVDYLRSSIVLEHPEASSLEEPCLPALLKILAGMVLGHHDTQLLLLQNDAYLVRLLLALEPIPTSAAIGDFATLILQNAVKDPSACAARVNEIRLAQIESARARAEQAREEALRQAAQPLSADLLALLADIHDEPWECCICKEGYEACPDEVLGIYVYCNRLGEVVNTATFFVCVHPSCHELAVPKERRGDRQVGEWTAAAVRNSERPCNAIFPLPSSTLAPGVYRTRICRYLEEARSRTKLDSFSLLVADVRHTLATLAAGERIPTSAGGGSLTALFSLIPFLVYAGHVVLAEGDARRAAEVRLEGLLAGGPADEAAVLSMWILTREEWAAVRPEILQRIVKQRVKAVGEEPWETKDLRDAFLMFILIDRIAELVKAESGIEVVKKENGALKVGAHKGAAWIEAWMTRVASDGRNLVAEFEEFAQEAESTLLTIGSLADAILFAKIGSIGPADWIAAALA